MWKSAIQMGLAFATFAILVIASVGLTASFIMQSPVFGYIVGVLSFLATGVFLLLGSCLYARQPLDSAKRYDSDGIPTQSWGIAVLGLRLMLASVFLFFYGLLFTYISLLLGV